MADLQYVARSGAFTVTGGGSATTVLQVNAPSNVRVKVLRLECSGNGTSSSDAPALLEILRTTTAGTASGVTLVKLDSAIGTTIQSTASETFTVEPTASDILFRQWVRLSGAPFVYQWAADSRIVIPSGGRLAVRLTPPGSTTATSFYATLVCEE